MRYRLAIDLIPHVVEFTAASPAELLMTARRLIIESGEKCRTAHHQLYVQWPDGGWAILQIRRSLATGWIGLDTTLAEARELFEAVEDEIAGVVEIKRFINSNIVADVHDNQPKLEIVKD